MLCLICCFTYWYSLKPKAILSLPKKFGYGILGSFIGFLSGLLGIGGGSLVVPLLSFYYVNITEAIATASVTGFLVAISGTLGYLIIGYNEDNLPEHAIATYIGLHYWALFVPVLTLQRLAQK